MKRIGRGLIISSVILAVSGSAFMVWGGRGDSGIQDERLTVPSVIRTAFPKSMDFIAGVHWFGVARSRSEVKVYAMSAGRIISQKAMDGAPVKRGDVLFTIGGPRALGELKALKEKTEITKKRIALAKKDVRVKGEAVKHKMIRGGELRAAEDSLMRLKTELAGLRQAMSALREGLTVRATVDGVFTDRVVNKGQYVEKGALLADIISSQNLRVVANIFPPAGMELKGLKAVINRPGGRVISGVVKRVMPGLTVEGATVLWIEGKDIDAFLKPNEPVSGEVELAARSGVLSIPESSIVRDDKERPFVFLKRAGKYIKKAVKTGLSSRGQVEILSGVKAEDEVVVSGAYELFYRDFSRVFKVAD